MSNSILINYYISELYSSGSAICFASLLRPI